MAAVGADVEQLRKAAQTFRQKAEYLESTITQGISRQITESPWKGADADSFRNQWQSDLAPKVRQVAEALRKSADSLTRNANEQEQASSPGGGSSGGGTSGGGGGSHSGGGTNSGSRDYLQDLNNLLEETKPHGLMWDLFNTALKPKDAALLSSIGGAKGLNAFFKGAGIIGSVNDTKNFWNAMSNGNDYDKFSSGVDLAGGLLQNAPFGSAPHLAGTALKAAKTIGEEASKAVSSGPWPKGVSVFDAMAECTGEKPAKDFIGRASQVVRGGAINLGNSVFTTIRKLF